MNKRTNKNIWIVDLKMRGFSVKLIGLGMRMPVRAITGILKTYGLGDKE